MIIHHQPTPTLNKIHGEQRMTISSQLDQAGTWIKDSPKVIFIVSLSSALSLCIALFNGCFSLLKHLDEIARAPKITLSNITTTKRTAITNMGQLVGTGIDYTIEGPLAVEEYPNIQTPFLNIKAQFLNPSQQATTFLHCQLNAVFSNGKKYSSTGYVETEQHLKGNHTTGNHQYFLRPGEAIEKSLMFFFIPFKSLQTTWHDQSVMLNVHKTSIQCNNEFGEIILNR